ncbi:MULTISPECIES: response regulator transcription factor [unclassified Arthrobacter]|uniref:response regulator transcription factor n=1 Tax=unclassified Arthrobacter TaxID=235627 RepID=UPI0002EDAC90|nr:MULTISPECIES: response regulator transcription factor [unclassified Arthrobacter]PVE19408.1 DNA-binding response regulator [Arthrobacter sp. Bz4]
MDSIRVLLADDQALVRAGFATMLSIEEDIEVVGQVTNGQEAVDFAHRHEVDVILMDVQMPLMDGIQATELITRAGRGKVIILTTFERDDYLFDAIRSGASGFLLKNADPDDLIAAVQAVAGGYALLAPEVTVRVIERFARSLEVAGETTPGAQPSAELRKRLDSLTQREKEILSSLATGLSNAELAGRFFLAEATVKSHVSSLLAKVQVRDRVQAVVFAYESGLIRPGE